MIASGAWDLLVNLTLQSTIVCLAAGVAIRLLRKAASAYRHLVLSLAVVVLLALPILSVVVPRRNVGSGTPPRIEAAFFTPAPRASVADRWEAAEPGRSSGAPILAITPAARVSAWRNNVAAGPADPLAATEPVRRVVRALLGEWSEIRSVLVVGWLIGGLIVAQGIAVRAERIDFA